MFTILINLAARFINQLLVVKVRVQGFIMRAYNSRFQPKYKVYDLCLDGKLL
jgi:hypothetical protein